MAALLARMRQTGDRVIRPHALHPPQVRLKARSMHWLRPGAERTAVADRTCSGGAAAGGAITHRPVSPLAKTTQLDAFP